MFEGLDLIKSALMPHTKRAYFVGGFVRDKLLGLEPKDCDIEVYDIDPQRFCRLMQTLGANGVGESFFVYRLGNIDLSLPRLEKKIGIGHSAFDVEWCNDPICASRRRDFTINSIMINIFDESLLDPNDGIADLKGKLLRHIDSKSFVEDSLRVLRAVQFSARFRFKIAPKTIELCKEIDLIDLHKDRVWCEFEKLMGAKHTLYGIYYLFKLGVFRHFFGEGRLDLTLCRWAKQTSNLLFLLRWRYKIPAQKIALAVGAPKRIYRDLIKWNLAPKNPSEKFLLATAIKGALNGYPPVEALRLQRLAQSLSIYHSAYTPRIKAADLMAIGISGKELGVRLRKEILKEIREYGRE